MNRLVRRFPILRDQLKSIRMDYDELARHIGRSERYISNRMTGHGSFTLDECYAIRSAVGLTNKTIEEVFPDSD